MSIIFFISEEFSGGVLKMTRQWIQFKMDNRTEN